MSIRRTVVIMVGFVASAGACKQQPTGAVASESTAVASAALEPTARTTFAIDPSLANSDRIRTTPAARRSLQDQVLCPAEALSQASAEASVGALVPGRIASVKVEPGQRVRQGEVLAFIDAPEAARLQGEWLHARAKLFKAQRLAEQERALWKQQATSERALQEAEADLRVAQAEHDAARNQLVTSRIPLPKEDGGALSARIAIHSPIDGVIANRKAVVGAFVSPDQTLFEVIEPAKLLVRADVPEGQAARVEPGTAATVTPRGADRGCPGRVASKLERIEPAKRTMGVMVTLDQPCPGLRAGSFADVLMPLASSGERRSTVVPNEAVVDLDGVPVVFVELSRQKGQYQVRPVRVGMSDGASTVIEAGVQEGEPVVSVGAFVLKGEYQRSELEGE